MYFWLLKHTNIEEYELYINEYSNFSKKYNKNIVLIIEDNISNKDKEKILKRFLNIKIEFLKSWKNLEENIIKIFEIIKRYYIEWDIFIIPWTNDSHGILVNNLYKKLWKKYTEDTNIFLYKDYLRNKLNENFTDNNIKFYTIEKKDKYNFSKIKKKINNFSFPLILKPTKWAWSKTVFFINNLKELEESINIIKDNEKVYQIEEFINWKMYSIDFYTNKNWVINFLPILRAYTSKELWLHEDLSNIFVHSEVNFKYYNLLENFIQKISNKFKFYNQFWNIDFYITDDKELKIIEINWRIWAQKLHLYNSLIWESILNLTLWKKDFTKIKYINNIFFIKLYSFKSLKSGKWKFNYNLINEILSQNNKNTFIKKMEEWKKDIWSSKLNFWYPAIMILHYNWKNKLIKWINFIKKNYKNLISAEYKK